MKDIDINQKTEFGVTNLQLMKNGNALMQKMVHRLIYIT
ncbi:Ribonuclease YobL [Bacillus subtilis subsp. subtilis]|nr:Ribonuclease YobL [Bacillus subtilis subsp. subtilis]